MLSSGRWFLQLYQGEGVISVHMHTFSPVASHCHTTRLQYPHLPLHRGEEVTYLGVLGDIWGKDQACSPQGLSLWHGPALNLLFEAAACPQASSGSALLPHQ